MISARPSPSMTSPTMSTMQQTKMVQLAPDTLDDFRPYCLAGLSLAGLATLSLFGLRFTPW